jgi:predicted RNase H-like HicB family nuclease
MIFPVICHYEDGGYWAEFPDLPGCFSQGDNEQDIIKNSKESLEGYLINLLESGQSIPIASSINHVKLEGEGFVSYVECSLIGETKYVRKNITLPEWMNVKAEKMGLNFSNVLQEAILAKLGMS